jgi:Zn-dependent M28 family amino/carboxypeptidase
MLIRSLATADLRLPHTGAMGYKEGTPRIPAAAISPEDAELIHRFLLAGETVKVSFALSCKTLPDAESANVIGEIRGSEAPDEVVVIGGHLDSWDVGTGAHDDGSGCAISMEAMRLIRSLGLKPKRTIRAVLFTNEENGLRGGKAYAEAYAAQLGKHVAAIESDSGGARPLGFGVSAGPGGTDIVRKLAAPLASFAADDVQEGGGGADISPMAPAGVPQLGLRQDTTHYFDVHHTMADTLDKIDAHDLAMNATAMAVMAWQLANLDPPLPRRSRRPRTRPSPGHPIDNGDTPRLKDARSEPSIARGRHRGGRFWAHPARAAHDHLADSPASLSSRSVTPRCLLDSRTPSLPRRRGTCANDGGVASKAR